MAQNPAESFKHKVACPSFYGGCAQSFLQSLIFIIEKILRPISGPSIVTAFEQIKISAKYILKLEPRAEM